MTNLTLKNKIKDGTVVLADKGYFNMEQIAECVNAKINLYINRPKPNGNSKEAKYQKDRFRYDAVNNQYICPMGKILKYKFINNQRGIKYKTYIGIECENCTKKAQCTNAKNERTIYRHEYEGIVEKVIQKTIINSKAYNRRNQIVEHPYGTIKRYFGYTYFNQKGLANVNAEASSFCFAYNLKRLLNIFSTQKIVTKINDIMKDKSTFVFLFLKKAFFTLLSAKIAINTKNQTNCETA